MSARNKRGECTYCGHIKKLTRDHVPPKVLLEQPFPINLRTVPACSDCNGSFDKDDEYTRTILGLDVRAAQNPAAQSILPTILRSLQSADAPGLAKALYRNSVTSAVLGTNGLPLGRVMTLDRKRVNRTGLHIMRGLYYLETRKRIASDATVRLESKDGLTAEHPDMLTLASIFRVFQQKQFNGSVGTAFSYTAGFAYGRSVWLMLLYDFYFWVGSIDERSIEERDEPILPAAPVMIF